MGVITFDISGSQIDGARDYQEDAFLITHLGGKDGQSAGSMVIVADGMGGHAAGNVASNMAVQTFNRHISKNFPNENMSNVLYEAVLQANGSITATVAETAALKGMGCTLVACVLERSQLRWVSVGDSHLYLLRAGDITKKNADHSYGGFLDRMADAGTPVEAEAGFSRNMLMSALTGDDIAEIDCPEAALELRNGDRVILSSDGLDTLAREKVVEISRAHRLAKDCVDALLQAVTDAGAPRQDNTTVIVIDALEKAEPDPLPQPVATPRETSAATQPAAVAASAPFISEEAPRKKSSLGVILALLVVLAILGGGGYWFMSQPERPPAASSAPASEPIVEAETPDEDVTDIEAVEPEPVTPAEVVPEAQPTPAPLPPPTAVAGPTGTFRDGLRGGGEGPLMVWIPAGMFTMGNPISTSDPDERPQHKVTLQPFALGVNEVTVAEFRRFARDTGLKMPPVPQVADETNFPMTFVSWNDALAYTKWLSQQTGKDYTLPTESQWEYAARAGSTSAYWWGRQLGRSNAHCFACDTGLDPRQPTAIGRFQPNKFGLYDTSGNVQEWVYDCYHPNYDFAPEDGNVFEGGDCSVRVLRGGGYGNGPDALTSAGREQFRVDKGNDQTGFRVARKN